MNLITKKISSLRLTRKEFLIYLGSFLMVLIGIPAILKFFSGEGLKKPVLIKNNKPTNFGSGAYGV